MTNFGEFSPVNLRLASRNLPVDLTARDDATGINQSPSGTSGQGHSRRGTEIGIRVLE